MGLSRSLSSAKLAHSCLGGPAGGAFGPEGACWSNSTDVGIIKCAGGGGLRAGCWPEGACWPEGGGQVPTQPTGGAFGGASAAGAALCGTDSWVPKGGAIGAIGGAAFRGVLCPEGGPVEAHEGGATTWNEIELASEGGATTRKLVVLAGDFPW